MLRWRRRDTGLAAHLRSSIVKDLGATWLLYIVCNLRIEYDWMGLRLWPRVCGATARWTCFRGIFLAILLSHNASCGRPPAKPNRGEHFLANSQSIRGAKHDNDNFHTICSFASHVKGGLNIVVRDEGILRFLEFAKDPGPSGHALLEAKQQSAVRCHDRLDAAAKKMSPKIISNGIMKPWDSGRSGGVIGIGSGQGESPPHSHRCRMRPCVVDSFLPWRYASLIRDLVAQLDSSMRMLSGDHRSSEGLRTLVLGGGGGQVPLGLFLTIEDIQVHVVDNDAEVISVGRDFFGLWSSADTRMLVFEADARDFLDSASNYYDVIILDVFLNSAGSQLMPLELQTCQCLRIVKEALKLKNAVVVQNVVTSDADLLGSILATYMVVFGEGNVFMYEVRPLQYLVIAVRQDSTFMAQQRKAAMDAAARILLGDAFDELRQPKRLEFERHTPISDPLKLCGDDK